MYKCTRSRKPFYELSDRQRRRIRSAINRERADDAYPRSFNDPTNLSISTLDEVGATSSQVDAATDSFLDISNHECERSSVHSDRESLSMNLSDSSNVSNNSGQTIVDDNDSEDDDDDGIDLREQEFKQRVAHCFQRMNVNHVQGDAILGVLRSHDCFSKLPKNTKTLIRTPMDPIDIISIPPGEYVHIGLEKQLIVILTEIPSALLPPILEMDFSTDGASLFKSGYNQIWPIQFRIVNIPNSKPRTIGIFKGKRKPYSPTQFFQPFVEEFNILLANGGVHFNGRNIPIKLRCFIADAPARSFILHHYGHMSAHPCSKCKVEGVSYRRHMVFPGIDQPARTDEGYLQHLYEDHQKEGESPLADLPIGMVSGVPHEYMHGGLGVMKKMVSAWVEGKFTPTTKLSANSIAVISSRLKKIALHCPREFARLPRGLNEHKDFKATEFRQLLLYTGPVVLRGVLDEKIYLHFLLLHAAFRILVSPAPTEYLLHFARIALREFVDQCEPLYGPRFLSYNVHCLLHLVDDVKRFGPLDNISAFPYENSMMYFRKAVRKPDRCLQQIVRRLEEACQNQSSFGALAEDKIITTQSHDSGPITVDTPPNTSQYRTLKTKNAFFGLSPKDNCCIRHDLTICIIRNILFREGTYYFVTQKFQTVEPFYDVGVPSSSVCVFKCANLSPELRITYLNDVAHKCYKMPCWSSSTDEDSDDDQAEILDDTNIVCVLHH